MVFLSDSNLTEHIPKEFISHVLMYEILNNVTQNARPWDEGGKLHYLQPAHCDGKCNIKWKEALGCFLPNIKSQAGGKEKRMKWWQNCLPSETVAQVQTMNLQKAAKSPCECMALLCYARLLHRELLRVHVKRWLDGTLFPHP